MDGESAEGHIILAVKCVFSNSDYRFVLFKSELCDDLLQQRGAFVRRRREIKWACPISQRSMSDIANECRPFGARLVRAGCSYLRGGKLRANMRGQSTFTLQLRHSKALRPKQVTPRARDWSSDTVQFSSSGTDT